MATQIGDLLLNQIFQTQQAAATQSQFQQLLNAIQALDVTIRDQTGQVQLQLQSEFQRLLQQLDAIRQEQQNIRANTETAQQASVPVTLPSVAPSTFLDATNDGTAAAIWNYTDFRGLFTAFGALYDVYNLVTGLTQSFALPTIGPAHFVISGAIAGVSNVNWPLLDLPSTDTILSSDANVGAWLNRQTSPLVWSFITGQEIWRHTFSGPPLFEVDCTLSASEFRWFRLANGGTVPGTNLPPVWPGLANVVLGTPVAMVPPGANIAAACDGVIVSITGTPSWAGSFSFGTAKSWRNVGAVTFTTDDGEQEFAQAMGWISGIYCPKSMAHAAGFAYRAAIGVSGTITPFTIS